MNALFLATLICIFSYDSILANSDEVKPSFKWISDGVFGDRIQIGFPDGGPNDVALLTPSIPSFSSDIVDKNDTGCIFHGYLRDDTDVEVFVSGCPEENSFQIAFDSDRLKEHVFNVVDENVQSVHLGNPYDGVSVDPVVEKIVEGTLKATRDSWSVRAQTGQYIRNVPKKMRVRLHISYDKEFLKNVASGSHSAAVKRINSILNIAKEIYKWKSLKTEIELDILDIKPVARTLKLHGSTIGKVLQSAENESGKNKVNADNYHYFSYDNKGGVSGIARSMGWTNSDASGSVCWRDKKRRTAISEWLRSDAETAMIFAHELGHSLGMPHDFCADKSCREQSSRKYARKDSKGKSCWENTVMDYYQKTVNKWSTCSVESMNAWYDDIVKEYGEYCLESIDGESSNDDDNTTGNDDSNGDDENDNGNEADNSSGNDCQDVEPNGNTYCKNVELYGGCEDKENSWYFDKYCIKTCNRCNTDDNAGVKQCIHYDGISSGTICCAQSCGICGGSGCGRRNGGARNCCGGKIRSTCGENGRKAPCRLSKI